MIPLRLGIIGAAHLHLFELVDGLVRSGATTLCHAPLEGPLADLYTGWRTDSRERPAAEILADPEVDLIVTAAIPAQRAAIAVASLEAGKNVLSDKPGATTLAQLDAILDAEGSSRGRWWVLFTERFTSRAMAEGVRRAAAGELGEIVHVSGAGPHSLNAGDRPTWFWDRTATGGILADLATHQVDQFLAATGSPPEEVAVVDSATGGPRSHPLDPGGHGLARGGFEDRGMLTLHGPTAVGMHHVDYLSPVGLGTWGDVRLTIVGTEATAEVRANTDLDGASGADHLFVVDAEGVHRIDCSGVTLDWAERLSADIADGSDRLMRPGHAAGVTRLCLQAQAGARPWGTRADHSEPAPTTPPTGDRAGDPT